MKIYNKVYKIAKTKELTVNYIEQHILESGFIPLRWCIVKSDQEFIIIDATVKTAH